MKRKNNLPTGVYKQNNGYRSQVSIFDHDKWKFVYFSCRSYETIEQAQHARQLVIDLIGTNSDRKKRFRRWQVKEVVNEYRKTLNLPLITEKP